MRVLLFALSMEATYKNFMLYCKPRGKAYNFMFRDDVADTDLDLSVADTNVLILILQMKYLEDKSPLHIK